MTPLPTIASLSGTAARVSASTDLVPKVRWSKVVLSLVERIQPHAKSKFEDGKVTDPELVRLADQAVLHVFVISDAAGPGSPIPIHVARALYLRGTLCASGSFPAYVPKDLSKPFKDFETAARSGYHLARFQLGHDDKSFTRGIGLNETTVLM